MGKFDYEKSIWGHGRASIKLSSPTSFRLRQSLSSIKALAGGAKVMELGSGAGQFIREIKAIRPDLECYGSDISEHAINLAKQANDGVQYDLSAEKKLPYADNFFDAILIFDVLEHVENPGAIFSEVHRTLKSGGVFYAFVPCEGDFLSFWNLLRKFGVGANLTKMYAGHINRFSREELVATVKAFGFEIKKIRYSEHILGQFLGLASFFSMDRFAKKNNLQQVNNEQYFYDLSQKGGGVLRLVKNLVNTAVALESMLFSRLPSPNVHLTVIKK
ncbi:MAG: class I SAM-dependent methyltransferase [Candidatus Magasanikbacteria bacterium]|nr:class I SAM-dependent methyltransferase [Candidatus Magasanikbacteria bacterium]